MFKERFLLYKSNSEKAEVILKEKGYNPINAGIMECMIFFQLNPVIPHVFIYEELSVDRIVSTVSTNIDLHGYPIGYIRIGKEILPPHLAYPLIKGRIKYKGEIWTIHKNDKDIFPSNPHAHNYERKLKLHLGNGKLYKNKIGCDHVNSKDLNKIRNLILKNIKDIELPFLEL